MLCDILRKFILPVISDNAKQFPFCIAVYNIPGTQLLPCIHTHIQRGIIFVGKISLQSIQLVGGHPQIQ